MRTHLIVIAGLGGLLLASPLLAQPGPPERVPKAGQELSKIERKHLRKSMKHRKLAHKHGNKAMRHKMMARENMMRFHDSRPGPMFQPDRPFGPYNQGFRGQGRQHFRNENFGPGRNPDCPVGPPQHMRFRDGKRQPRAQ